VSKEWQVTNLDRDRIEKYVGESLMLVTVLGPVIAYDKASAIAHKARRTKARRSAKPRSRAG